MYIRNTSRYETEEVRRLVQFATKDMDTKHVCVNVKNCGGAYKGWAYKSVPRISNAPASAKYLIVLRIGKPEMFPVNNLVKSRRWVRVKPNEKYNPSEVRGCGNGTERWLEREVITEHSYGGKSSPFMEMKDWREGLIALAAHEMTHITQYRHNWATEEWMCESAALKVLESWRAATTSATEFSNPKS